VYRCKIILLLFDWKLKRANQISKTRQRSNDALSVFIVTLIYKKIKLK